MSNNRFILFIFFLFFVFSLMYRLLRSPSAPVGNQGTSGKETKCCQICVCLCSYIYFINSSVKVGEDLTKPCSNPRGGEQGFSQSSPCRERKGVFHYGRICGVSLEMTVFMVIFPCAYHFRMAVLPFRRATTCNK